MDVEAKKTTKKDRGQETPQKGSPTKKGLSPLSVFFFIFSYGGVLSWILG